MNRETGLRMLKIIGKNRGSGMEALLAALLSVIAVLLGPLLIGRAIDQMLGINAVDFNGLANILLALALIYLIGTIFGWLLIYLTNSIAYQTANDLRHQLIDKVNSLPLNFFDNQSHGDTSSRFINDVDAISDGLLQGIATLLTGIVTICGAIGFMLLINPVMTVVVLLSAPASFLMARFITRRSQQLFKVQAKCLGKLNGYAEEIISGQKTVKAFCYEQPAFAAFEAINSTLYDVGIKSQFYGSLSGPTTRLVNNITFAVIGVIGCTLAIAGRLTVGDITGFLIYSNLFAKPFNDLSGVFTQIQAAMASAQRVFGILDLPAEKPDAKNAVVLKNSRGAICFKQVSFSYDPGQPLISDFDLDVKPGSSIAIVGQTGAGKTTMVNLLMRFYAAEAHDFIMRLPDGYDTLVADAGENLSQGQRQLLTIARVMLIDPPMLILDEATSSIDSRTEIHIQKAFMKMIKGRTSFVIAHRLSTIREADQILVLDHGHIVESGSHQQLLKNRSYYEKLYRSQFVPVLSR